MKTDHCLKFKELQTILYCRKVITLLLVTEEMSKSKPDFENESIIQAKLELKIAGDDVSAFLSRHFSMN